MMTYRRQVSKAQQLGGIETVMRVLLKHEAMCAGNVSVTDVYDCSEVELRTMVERDRCLRAIRMGCSPRDIALRTPQTILQELWNAEERSAHSFHRSDRASGAAYSYEELADIGQEPQGYSASPEDILLSAEETREEANCLQTIFREVEKLPAGQRNIVKGVFVKGTSQSDMARELGVSRAGVQTAFNGCAQNSCCHSRRKRSGEEHDNISGRRGKGLVMVHFSVTRVRGSGPYDLDACGDILAIARAVGAMSEDAYAGRRNITQCDGDGYRENDMFRLELDTEKHGVRHGRHAR